MYTGLSATGPAEVHELRLLRNRVLLIAPRARQAQVSVVYRNFDLGYQLAISAFASPLCLSAERFRFPGTQPGRGIADDCT